MAEYIKREDALGCVLGVFDRQRIKELHAADVEEVKHGKWIYEERENSRLVWLNCSVCGWKSLDQSVSIVYHYCPNCGAKMDLED